MGNAPLPKPPAPTDRRVVVPIAASSRRWFDTQLVVWPPLTLEDGDTVGSSTNTSSYDSEPPNIESVAEEENLNGETAAPHASEDRFPAHYPVQFRRDPEDVVSLLVPVEDYESKLHELRGLLKEWKGGQIYLAIGIVSLSIVVGFFVAWMFPAFATSDFVLAHPMGGLTLCVAVIALYTLAFRMANRSTTNMMQGVEELFGPWKRAHGIRVHLQKVSHLTLPEDCSRISVLPKATRPKLATRTTNCFCLIMAIVEDGSDDAVSLGTVHTNGSDETD